MQSARPTMRIHRAPRKWPYIPSEPVTVESVQPPNKPSNTALIVTFVSIIGLGVAAFVYSRASSGSSILTIGFLAISGFSTVGSLVTFFVQRAATSQETRALTMRYTSYLDTTEKSVGALASEEHAARRANDLSLNETLNDLARHPEHVWQRKPTDPDFLAVRVGMGDAPPLMHVQFAGNTSPFAPPASDSALRAQQERAREIVDHYRLARDVPVVVPLREHNSVTLINGGPGVAGSSALARAMVAQVVVHHAPNDVQVAVFAPAQTGEQWHWVASLPTGGGDWQGLAIRQDERQQQLSLLLGELNRRQQMVERQHTANARASAISGLLPHILIVVDSFAEIAESDPLTSPAVALALQHGREIGATVLSVHSALSQAPNQATLAVDAAHYRITALGPDPVAEASCASIDSFDVSQGQAIARALEHRELEAEASLDVPAKVRLLTLMNPAINRPEEYPIEEVWRRGAARLREAGKERSFIIPLGRKVGDEPVYLDFVGDGPHGLLIGQTGSGKSEMLLAIIAALAIQYPPDLVNFILVDYKGGLTFDAFGPLPHTVSYLTNMAQPGQTNRFLEMLEAEIVRRQAARTRQEPQPELFVIIDEFAEMVSRRSTSDTNEVVLDKMLSICRLGRALGMHLLFAAQRPDGSVIQKLRGYVQYRICLRTNTEEDSREVINVPDAAQLPIEIPGRGYLLRGDNELTLLQAARITTPSFQSGMLQISRTSFDISRDATFGSTPRTADTIIAERMGRLTDSPVAVRWPMPLPEPTFQMPTPLVIAGSATPVSGEIAWSAGQHATLRPLEIPIGLYDRPSEQRQEWFIADLVGYTGRMNGGPLIIMGDMNSGKTTALQSLLFFAAGAHNPADLRIFALNPGGSLAEFVVLPHASDLFESGARNVIDGQNSQEFSAFAERFKRAAQHDPNTRPALLLVVDDYDELGGQYGEKLHELATLAIRQRERRVYLAVSAARQSFNGLPQTIINNMATRIGLYMSDRDHLRTIITGRLPTTLDAIPGRGWVQTRRSLAEIQVAAPVAGKDDAERMERLEERLRRLAQHWQ